MAHIHSFKSRGLSLCSVFLFLLFINLTAFAQQRVVPTNRVTEPIDNRLTVVRTGDLHPMARPRFDQGPASADLRMDRMMLVLQPDPAQQQDLDEFLAAQQDPASPDYRQWLTPEAFGDRFGVSQPDVDQAIGWLQSSGFTVEPAPSDRRHIIFSGPSDRVNDAFHTEIRIYDVDGARHFANATPPQIPQALDPVVGGVASLHDFRSVPLHTVPRATGSSVLTSPFILALPIGPRADSGADSGAHTGVTQAPRPTPTWTSGGSDYLTPGDFGVIYDVAPLYSAATNGSGQSIAVLGRTNIAMSDVQTFRSTFGLPTNNPTVVLNGPNPGIISQDEETEADLDVEWSGAIAPNAAINFVVSQSTATDGIALSAQYAVSNNISPVITLSFGSCEQSNGTSGNQFWNSLWQQAASQGITVLVAAGDSGAAGCDSGGESTATGGLAVNALCSSPYSTCVGGTQFNDTATSSQYWSSSNSATYVSALSYIPELAWNQSGTVSGGSGLWAGGGGASSVYAKPSWQAGAGVPADGKRDVPDISLTASTHDPYLIYMSGSFYMVGGTSASTPSFAGLMALADQRASARIGNVNPLLYGFATRQTGGGAAVFHDIATGNNTVPGLTGFNAGAGYDLVTGLGTVDAALLINHWNDAAGPSFVLSATPTSVTVADGAHTTTSVKLTASGGFSSSVTLTATGLPSGVTAAFAPSTLPAGTTASTLTLTATSAAARGSFSFNISGASGNLSNTLVVPITIAQACSYSLSATSASAVATASTSSVQVTAPAGCTWTASTTASWIGITSGATGNGNGTVGYTVSANSTRAARSGSISVTGAGQTSPVALTISQAAAPFSLNTTSVSAPTGASTGTITVTAGSSTATWTAASNVSWVTISSGASGKGNGTVAYSIAANTATAARTGTLTVAGLTFTVNQAGAACSYTVTPTSATVAATAGSYTLQVTTTSGCTWTAVSNSSFLSVTAGASGSGSGSVTYAATPNTSAARSATLTVAKATINIAQSAPAAGTPVFSLNPGSASVAASASTGSVAVTASVSTSTWTAVSNANWITVTSGASGKGNGSVGYSIAANTGTGSRSGTITIAGNAFTVTQSGVACTGTLGNASVISNSGGFAISFPVTIATGCSWTATSNEPWLTVTSGATDVGNGTAVYEGAINNTGAQRSAIVVVAGVAMEITEAPLP